MNKHSIDLFQEACGAAGQLQVTVHRPGQTDEATKKLFLPLALIGRSDHTDLPLVDPEVSRRHAYMQLIGGRLFGIDLCSRTGTHWKGGGKTGAGWIGPGEPIRIGPFTLEFQNPQPANGSSARDSWNPLKRSGHTADAAGPEVTLEWAKGPIEIFPWHMTSILALIGRRAHHLGLVIEDPSVSSFQCSLLRTPIGTWVVDLLGQGGVILNGRRVRWGRLDDGDQLQFGRYTFRIHYEGPVRPSRREQARAAEAAPEVVVGQATQPPPGNNGNLAPVLEPVDAEVVGPALAPVAATSVGGPLVAITPYLTKADLNETVLAPLFNQFAAMQNQMFDQFQQALMMMVEMFSEMQRDQVSLIREEVSRLHQITEELQTLQEELARQPAPAPGWVPPAGFAEAPADDQEPPTLYDIGLGAEQAEAGPLEKLLQEEAFPAPQPETVATASPPPAAAPPRPPVTEPIPSPAAEAAQPPAAESPAQPSLRIPQPPLAAVDGEVHVWLYQKIAALQRERQSRLQKIISFLRGK